MGPKFSLSSRQQACALRTKTSPEVGAFFNAPKHRQYMQEHSSQAPRPVIYPLDATNSHVRSHEKLERRASLEADSLLSLSFTCHQILVHSYTFLGSYGLCKS